MVILEGAAVGTPTLAIDAAGVRDAIIDGKTGVLVPAMSESLSQALADEWIRLAADDWTSTALEPRGTAVGSGPHVGLHGRRLGVPSRRRDWCPHEAPTGGRFSLNLGQAAAPVARGRSPTPRGSRASAHRRRSHRPAADGGLFGAFRRQFEDPDGFYSLLASDTIDLLRRYDSLEDRNILDVGGGPGYLAERFRKEGARSSFVESIWEEMTDREAARIRDGR